MSNLDGAWQTYSFDSAQAARYLRELVEILVGRGVDVNDTVGLKAGFEALFHIEYRNLPDLDARGCILASNHVSDFDALILGLLHPAIMIVSKSAWVDSPELMRFLSPHYRLIGLDRDSAAQQARTLVRLIRYLREPGPARHALIFPQGTISDIAKNGVERVQPGVFAMSAKSGVPVLPVYIEQPSFQHPTRVVFGRPMPIPDHRQDCRADWLDAVVSLQNSLSPPARAPILTEKHANNNKPGDRFFS